MSGVSMTQPLSEQQTCRALALSMVVAEALPRNKNAHIWTVQICMTSGSLGLVPVNFPPAG